MHPKTLVKWSNRIAIVAILALIYWVFAFILIQVFDLRIFRQNLTEIFFLSVLGILAVMAGSLMLNIMLNLTQIANGRPDDSIDKKSHKGLIIALMSLFVIIGGLLFVGDFANTNKKRQLMNDAVSQIVQSDGSQEILQLVQQTNTHLTEQEILTISSQLEQMKAYSPAINNLEIIIPYVLNGKNVFLTFDVNAKSVILADKTAAELIEPSKNETKTEIQTFDKKEFIQYFNQQETQYLEQVFANQANQPYFTHEQGQFDLWYPYIVNGKTLAVYHVGDYMRYGKYGS